MLSGTLSASVTSSSVTLATRLAPAWNCVNPGDGLSVSGIDTAGVIDSPGYLPRLLHVCDCDGHLEPAELGRLPAVGGLNDYLVSVGAASNFLRTALRGSRSWAKPIEG